MERGLSERQWIDYGALLKQIHSTALPPELARTMRRDPLAPAGAAMVRKLDAHIGVGPFDDPAATALATFWRARREDIRALLGRAYNLGCRLAQVAPAFVLCHAVDAFTSLFLPGNIVALASASDVSPA